MTTSDDISAAGLAVKLAVRAKPGTYTPISGATLADEPGVEIRFAIDADKRATMDVLVSRVSIPDPQLGASWTAARDGEDWTVHDFRQVPGVTVLQVERIMGTGANT